MPGNGLDYVYKGSTQALYRNNYFSARCGGLWFHIGSSEGRKKLDLLEI